MTNRRILVTGAAGFIGFHVSQYLVAHGDTVIGIDNFNEYYPSLLKRKRAELLLQNKVCIYENDIAEPHVLRDILIREKITDVIHLAAQAGVRYSISHPEAYIHSNIDGFLQLLEALKHCPHTHLVYASSSSVYGLNKKVPFSVDDRTDCPANVYGATKKTNELLAATYNHLFRLSAVGLRFFTVYGPWGRPDMAYYHFAKAIRDDRVIDVYNHGKMKRDFTYIDDIVQGIVAALSVRGGHSIFNLGNEKPEPLLYLIELIESGLGKKARMNMLAMQPGEIEITYADISKSREVLGYDPKISLAEGMEKFMSWFQQEMN